MNDQGADKVTILDNETLRKERAKELVQQMTLEEKAGLCSGQDYWTLKSVERLGLQPIMMVDGPHGVRKQIETKDNLGIGDSEPAVCFPTASALACSFDRELLYEVGEAIGEECLQEGVSVILGPGVNQKRSPLCGRNFEYFSEDSLVSGELATGMIQGVQSKGIGTSLKHFAVNNQETRRMTISAVVDERTLRETYLKAFEIAVTKGKPWTVMCSYNQLNGTYCSEHDFLLSDILRKEWGFKGLVVSDWGAVSNRAAGVKAGLDLEMPGSNGSNDRKMIEAVRNGELSLEALDKSACQVTELILKGMENRKSNYHYDVEQHHQLAIRAAEESAVLLKNMDNILPGKTNQKVAVIGALAKEPRYQGAGSSKIHPIRIENAWDSFLRYSLDVEYAAGYTIKQRVNKMTQEEDKLFNEALTIAKDKEVVYVFAGLPEGYESEAFDRSKLSLPINQNCLIEALVQVNPNIVVILQGGAPMELPWVEKVKGILLCYLGGEGGGAAVVNLLLGKAVPSGKLAETWPLKLSDNPSYLYFPGGRNTVEYRESIFVGYRYYEASKKAVRYPFGYGLSYTSFSYKNLRINQSEYEYGDEIIISFELTNHGTVKGKETVMVFVGHQSDQVFIPPKELREFQKINLEQGETKKVTVILDTKNFGYYSTLLKGWYTQPGEYKIMVCSSGDVCQLSDTIIVHNKVQPQPNYAQICPSYFHLYEGDLRIPDQEFESLYGSDLPESSRVSKRPYHRNHTLEDVKYTMIGRTILLISKIIAKKYSHGSMEEEKMILSSVMEIPFRSLPSMSGGMVSEKFLEGLLTIMNGHLLKGIGIMVRKGTEK